jgi:hypothetical protein
VWCEKRFFYARQFPKILFKLLLCRKGVKASEKSEKKERKEMNKRSSVQRIKLITWSVIHIYEKNVVCI